MHLGMTISKSYQAIPIDGIWIKKFQKFPAELQHATTIVFFRLPDMPLVKAQQARHMGLTRDDIAAFVFEDILPG